HPHPVIHTLSLPDALPIWSTCPPRFQRLQAPAETNSQAIPQLAPQPALLGMIRHTGVPLEPQVTLCHLLWNTSPRWRGTIRPPRDRKSTRLNSSHRTISYA